MNSIKNSFEFLFKKTADLTEKETFEIVQVIRDNLNNSFTKKDFEEKYLNNFKSYSYHGLLKLNDTIVGVYNAIPYIFGDKKKKYKIAQSVDTVIDKKIRGNPYNLKKIADLVYENLQKDNFVLIYGVPNEKIYKVRKKILNWKDLIVINRFFYLIKINSSNKYFLNTLIISFVNFFSKIKNFVNIKNINYSELIKNNDLRKVQSKDIVNNEEDLQYSIRIKFSKLGKIIYILRVSNFDKKKFEHVVQDIKIKFDPNIIVFMTNENINFGNFIKVPSYFSRNRITLSGRDLNRDDKFIEENIFKIFFSLGDLDIY